MQMAVESCNDNLLIKHHQKLHKEANTKKFPIIKTKFDFTENTKEKCCFSVRCCFRISFIGHAVFCVTSLI